MADRLPIPDADTFEPGGPGAAMAAYAQFVVWKLEERADSKPAKMPCDPANGHRVSAHNPANWMVWQDALTIARQRNLGIGFVFTEQDPFAFVDLDGCRDDAGEWTGLASDIYWRFPEAYSEISQSGRGLHLIFKADVPPHGKRTDRLEFYTGARFVALTGSSAEGDAGADLTARIPDFLADYGLAPTEDSSFKWTDCPDPGWSGPQDDKELIERMLNARPSPHGAFGEKATFAQLWQGDASALDRAFPSESMEPFDHSRADAALCAHLAFWTGRDCERMDRLFRCSGLCRDKWDRDDYRERTIRFAIDNFSEVYSREENSSITESGLPVVWFHDIEAALSLNDFVENFLGVGGMSVLYGEPNSGKSFFACDLGLHIALGRPWMGREIDGGPVLYVATEGGYGMQNRIAAFRQYHKIDDIPFAMIPASVNLLSGPADKDAIIDAARGVKERTGQSVRLIVIDTLSRAIAGGNENASEDMGALVRHCDEIRQATGAHVMLVHHSGKDRERGARGHSLLRAATDTEIEISRDADSGISIAHLRKQRNMEIGGPITFCLSTVLLGQNQRGKPVTSCVIESASPQPKKLNGQPEKMRQILKSLQNGNSEWLSRENLRDACEKSDGAGLVKG